MLETNELKLNQIQLNSLMKNLNKIKLMMKNSGMDYTFHIEDKEKMIIGMQFDGFNQSILFKICPGKILSKQIIKWR